LSEIWAVSGNASYLAIMDSTSLENPTQEGASSKSPMGDPHREVDCPTVFDLGRHGIGLEDGDLVG
jgi:hypothetical protein